jgi:hypothetical protein
LELALKSPEKKGVLLRVGKEKKRGVLRKGYRSRGPGTFLAGLKLFLFSENYGKIICSLLSHMNENLIVLIYTQFLRGTSHIHLKNTNQHISLKNRSIVMKLNEKFLTSLYSIETWP